MKAKKRNILVVDDDRMHGEFLQNVLSREGYNVSFAASGQAALDIAKASHFDLVLTDFLMPQMDGLELLQALRKLYPSLSIIILTVHSSIDAAKAAIRLGAFDYLLKPFDVDQLSKIVRKALENRSVFVVHGHDNEAKEAVARYLERLKLSPVILHEQPNAGKTIIEKFERYSTVEFVIVLLTPDDICTSEHSRTAGRPRPRQNVIFELGYFIGRLGRDRVCALYKEGVEIPSDYRGVLYIPMDREGGWRMSLAREIKAAGLDVDMNKAI